MTNNIMLEVQYGEKVLEPIKYTLKRIKPTGFFKWFKNDEAELASEFGVMKGDYDWIVENAILAGINFTVIDDG